MDVWGTSVAIAAFALLAGTVGARAQGLAIELKDVAPDRVERQRAAALGALPLPGTPDLTNRAERLKAKGLKAGDQVFLRVFKSESLLELWMRKENGAFVLFETYPICHWSGTLGPKVSEGDKQNPEGFYTVTRSQLHLIGRHPRSLNLGFPNPYDKAFGRNGSYILVHGGCTSVGCFAMTNAVIAEIYDLAEEALKKGGQSHIHVHAFPFRMTDENLAEHKSSQWHEFWTNLRDGYDAFERTRMPPRIAVCDKRYTFQPLGPSEGAAGSPLAVCGATVAAISQMARSKPVASLRQGAARPLSSPAGSSTLAGLPLSSSSRSPTQPRSDAVSNLWPRPESRLPMSLTGRSALGGPVPPPGTTTRTSPSAAAGGAPPCNLELASCRKWSSLKGKTPPRAETSQRGRSSAAR